MISDRTSCHYYIGRYLSNQNNKGKLAVADQTNFSIKVMSLQTCSVIYYPFTIRNSNNLGNISGYIYML